jgi:hypothetical protein
MIIQMAGRMTGSDRRPHVLMPSTIRSFPFTVEFLGTELMFRDHTPR